MGGLSKFVGSKGANQWEQSGIMRFELPFDAWCLKCERHMSKGLRFNAKKEKEGKYFSTQIFAFLMKCPSCEHPFKILTDPQNDTYDMKEGLRKHEQDFEPELGDSIIAATTDEARLLLVNDPMFRLQHGEEDRRKALNDQERIDALIDLNEVHSNQYDRNAELRATSRKRKKRDIELAAEGAAMGMGISLLEQSEEDAEGARQALFHKTMAPNFSGRERLRLANIQHQNIFQKDKKSSRSRESGGGSSSMSGSRSSQQYQHNSQLLAKAAALQIDSRSLKISSAQTAAAKPIKYLKTVAVITKAKQGSSKAGPSSTSGSGAKPVASSSVAKPVAAASVLDMLAGY
jgi:hypothetical protein